jgi:hypothetical protein
MSSPPVTILAAYGSPPSPKVPLTGKQIPLESLVVGTKGSIYDIRLDVQGLTEKNAVATLDMLQRELLDRFGIEIVYGTVVENGINLIIKGSPFAWAVLLAALPLILGALGLSMVGLSVWQIFANVPGWVWWTFGIGAGLFLFGPRIGNWIARRRRDAVIAEELREEEAEEKMRLVGLLPAKRALNPLRFDLPEEEYEEEPEIWQELLAQHSHTLTLPPKQLEMMMIERMLEEKKKKLEDAVHPPSVTYMHRQEEYQ